VSEPTDLTEKIELQETHIVSETLVEILLKQGKTEKAVEMLKKLIWKFPQKKAYFAARIEELKK
jgi:predicted Zn-dependent protease